MTATCQVDGCQSRCHDPEIRTGPYCAPTLATARVERDEAMSHVARSTPSEWAEDARISVAKLAKSGEPFSTDDVWADLESRSVPAPIEPRALGPIMSRFVRIGVLEHVGYTPSVRRHATPIRTFRGSKS